MQKHLCSFQHRLCFGYKYDTTIMLMVLQKITSFFPHPASAICKLDNLNDVFIINNTLSACCRLIYASNELPTNNNMFVQRLFNRYFTNIVFSLCVLILCTMQLEFEEEATQKKDWRRILFSSLSDNILRIINQLKKSLSSYRSLNNK